MPKDIPFNLSIEGLLILIEICIIYIYIIYTLSSEKKSSNVFLTTLINNIFKPLEVLDHSIKNHPLINPYYKRFIIYLAYKLDPILLHDSQVYYYTFAIFPRLVLVTALWIDTFHFHELRYIYKVLLIGILLILNRYLIYSLKYAKEHFITQLEPLISPYRPSIRYNHQIYAQVYYNGDEEAADDDYEGEPTMCLELKVFVYYASRFYYLYDEKLEYSVMFNKEYRERYCKKHNILIPENEKKSLPYSIIDKISKELNQKIDNIVQIATLLRYYELYHEYTPEIKRMKVLIFTNYLLCWIYILIMSITTLPTDTFQFIWEIVDKEEPFSGLYSYVNNK
jgi:hypothetical protein